MNPHLLHTEITSRCGLGSRSSMAWQPVSLLDRMEASLVSLTPSEQRVGRLCLEDPRTFANLPVSELARRACVSNPTVIRFCRSIGFDGLSDLKSKLVGQAAEGVPFVHPHVDVNDKTVDVMVKVIDSTVCAIRNYRNLARATALDQAVAALGASAQANQQIFFFGASNSGTVAQDAQFKFYHMGVRTSTHVDCHLQLMGASVLGPGDCAVLISHSGRNSDLMDVCDIARKNGATTIVMTASGTPLANAGHVHICVDPALDVDQFSPMVSRLLHLMVIDILVTCVALQMGSSTLERRTEDIRHRLRHKQYD